MVFELKIVVNGKMETKGKRKRGRRRRKGKEMAETQ